MYFHLVTNCLSSWTKIISYPDMKVKWSKHDRIFRYTLQSTQEVLDNFIFDKQMEKTSWTYGSINVGRRYNLNYFEVCISRFVMMKYSSVKEGTVSRKCFLNESGSEQAQMLRFYFLCRVGSDSDKWTLKKNTCMKTQH